MIGPSVTDAPGRALPCAPAPNAPGFGGSDFGASVFPASVVPALGLFRSGLFRSGLDASTFAGSTFVASGFAASDLAASGLIASGFRISALAASVRTASVFTPSWPTFVASGLAGDAAEGLTVSTPGTTGLPGWPVLGVPGRLASLLGGFTVQGSLPDLPFGSARAARPAPGGSRPTAQLLALVLASGPSPERDPCQIPVGPGPDKPARSASSSGRSGTKWTAIPAQTRGAATSADKQ